MSAVPLWRFFCGGAFVMRTVAVLLGWSWPSRVIQIFNQISGLLAKQNFLGWSALGDTQWVWRSKADNYRGCTMYRLGGGGHLGDSLFLQRRATIMDKYAQLRLTHPALHSDLRDFQVNCGCQRLGIALPFWKYYHTETTSAGWHNGRGHWPRGQAPHSELSVFVIVFIFVFAEKVWNSGRDRLHWSIACDPTEKMPVQKSEIWYWEIQLVKIKKSNSAGGLQKGGESSGRDSLGDCGNICEGNLLFRVIFGKFMHRWFLICAQLGSYNVSFLNYRPPKLKYGFLRGSFARPTSQSQAGTLSSCWHDQNNQKTQTFHGVFQGWSNILPRVLQSDPQKVQGGQCWGFRTLHVQGEKNNYILKKNIYMFNKISKYVQENKYPRKICLRKILTCSKKYLLI